MEIAVLVRVVSAVEVVTGGEAVRWTRDTVDDVEAAKMVIVDDVV